jgi:predicted AlkP superfamily pyrophosphatase or phosphodiesterase
MDSLPSPAGPLLAIHPRSRRGDLPPPRLPGQRETPVRELAGAPIPGRELRSLAVSSFFLRILLTLVGVVSIGAGIAGSARAEEIPRLVLVLVIDQLRADRVGAELPGGLGRLAREGRFYTEAALDHALTETCPGHATILSGCHPARAGIPGNRFLDLAKGEAVYCVADSADSARVLGGAEGRSPRNLRVATLGDWMKSADPASRVFSVSGKDRAAITLAGHSADAAYWFQGEGEIGFTTSGYYLDRLPHWVREFNGEHPPEDGFLARVPARWDHLVDEGGAPDRPDDFPGESSRYGRTSGHPLRDGDPEEFAARLSASPFLDEASLDFATALLREEGLGRRSSPDLLAVSLSGMDFIGHLYGPYSHESEDALRRLDLAVGRFLDLLELELGPGAVLAVLTSDHGVLPLPEWLERTGADRCPVPGGRTSLRWLGLRLLAKLHWELSPLFSLPRPWLIFADSQIGVDRSLARRHGVAVEEVVAATRRILESEPSIARVWTPEEIASETDEIAHLYRNSFDPERSGDLMVQLAPTCLVSPFDEGTSHGTPYLYDRAIPLIFWGVGIEGGRVPGPARTVDIAPTLARRLGIEPPDGLDGRPLFD